MPLAILSGALEKQNKKLVLKAFRSPVLDKLILLLKDDFLVPVLKVSTMLLRRFGNLLYFEGLKLCKCSAFLIPVPCIAQGLQYVSTFLFA